MLLFGSMRQEDHKFKVVWVTLQDLVLVLLLKLGKAIQYKIQAAI